jgi:hypothetical protein
MPDAGFAGDLLTDGQRRHIIASLGLVAAALSEIESIAAAGDVSARSPIDRVNRDVPDGFAEAARVPLGRARAALADLVAALSLEPRQTSAFRTIQALVVSSLVVLEDAGAKYLRGYGPIHPALPQTLEPGLRRIHEEVAAIGELLAASPSRTRIGERGIREIGDGAR